MVLPHLGCNVLLKRFWKPRERVSWVAINQPGWPSHHICCFFPLLASLPLLSSLYPMKTSAHMLGQEVGRPLPVAHSWRASSGLQSFQRSGLFRLHSWFSFPQIQARVRCKMGQRKTSVPATLWPSELPSPSDHHHFSFHLSEFSVRADASCQRPVTSSRQDSWEAHPWVSPPA